MDLITLAMAKKYVRESLAGAGALKGDKGDPGLSAYETAVKNGFSGSEADWLASLKGKNGETPRIGEDGKWYVGNQDTGVVATPVMSYVALTDIPTVNGKEITGNLTSEDIGIKSMTNQEVDELF